MVEYIQPKKRNTRFTCPYCNTLSSITWHDSTIVVYNDTYYVNDGYVEGKFDSLHISTCAACDKYHVWLNDKMIFRLYQEFLCQMMICLNA